MTGKSDAHNSDETGAKHTKVHSHKKDFFLLFRYADCITIPIFAETNERA